MDMSGIQPTAFCSRKGAYIIIVPFLVHTSQAFASASTLFLPFLYTPGITNFLDVSDVPH